MLFDRAAEQICAGCLLQRDCWQAHYNDTYNAFNDACPRLLRRGSACAEDFPLHFASRCLHFPQLLEAIQMVAKTNVVGADVNELAPMLDQSGVSTAAACKVLRELLLALSQ